jgi:hypothetical protein
MDDQIDVVVVKNAKYKRREHRTYLSWGELQKLWNNPQDKTLSEFAARLREALRPYGIMVAKDWDPQKREVGK